MNRRVARSRGWPKVTLQLLIIATATAASRAAETWMLTDASLTPVGVHDVAIAGAAVKAAAADGEDRQTPIDQFVSLARAGATTTLPQGVFVLHTTDGQRWVGSPVSSTAEEITWSTMALGQRSIPLTSVVGIDRALTPPPATGDAPQEDVATLANRDVVRGVVSSIDAESLVMTVGDAPTTVALANLAAVRFAATEATAAPAAAYAVTLIDGSLVYATGVEATDGGWTVALEGDARPSLKSEQIVRVDHLAGPVRWLSSLSPQVVYTPYLGESYPPRMDSAVDGSPIRFVGRTYDRGIGVHARTVLTFPLDGSSYKSFRTRYAPDPEMTLTDAIVRVKVDGRVVHESHARSGAISPVVWADLNGAKTLVLEVDFGAGLHAQDRVNWIEPALMKSAMPTTAPTE